jgi:hypothetical protein
MKNLVPAMTLVVLVAARAGGEDPRVGPLYWKCIDPTESPCRAFTEEQKAQCPGGCDEWQEMRIAALAKGAWSGDGRVAANVFLNTAASEIYGREIPKTEFGHPVTVAQFSRHPEKYGWAVVSRGSPPPGSLALFDGFAGVVVDSVPGAPPYVLYPSHRKGGKLTVSKADHLGGAPKYLVPMGTPEQPPKD